MTQWLQQLLGMRAGPKRRPDRRTSLRLECLEERHCPAPVAPSLSSLPGANKTIFLQFTGRTTENTQFNTDYNLPAIVSPPYDIDGNPETFSAIETARIKEIYNQVAEAFIPFAINVTTVGPGPDALKKTSPTDTKYGIRVVITEDTLGLDSIGSIDSNYFGSFNWADGTPAFVYTSGQMRTSTIAMTACHIIGHTMGLDHDGDSTHEYQTGFGTGPLSWAPIMGAGFGQSVFQWSNGGYYDSNNSEDDLAIITTQNGFGYRADDHGNSTSTATPLTFKGSYGTGSGIITQNTDADMFSFTTGAGLITLNGDSFAPGSVLKVKMDLYDSTGQLIGTSNPADSMNAQIAVNVAAGTYYVRISGGAAGDPMSSTPTGFSNYGSLGRYTLTVNRIDPSNRPTLTISDTAAYNSSGTAYFAVTLSGAATSTVNVSYSTTAGSATANSDYTPVTGTLKFLVGVKTLYLGVPIVNTPQYEEPEKFAVNVSTTTAGVIVGRPQAKCTIYTNFPAVTINNAGVAKPTSGQTTLTFSVALTQPSAQVVTVNYSLVNGTAVAGTDFLATSGTLTFQPGEATKTIIVTVNGNNVTGIKAFTVKLSNATNATLLDPKGIGTIVDIAQSLRYLAATNLATVFHED